MTLPFYFKRDRMNEKIPEDKNFVYFQLQG